MEKIREALLRARENEEFRAAHPVSELPPKPGSPKADGEGDGDRSAPPPEPAQPARSEVDPVPAPAGDVEGTGAVDPAPATPEPQDLPVETAMAAEEPLEKTEAVEVQQSRAAGPSETAPLPEPPRDPEPSRAPETPPEPEESAGPAAQFDLEPIPIPVPDSDPDPGPVDQGVVEKPGSKEGVFSGARLLRVVAYLGFGVALLTGVHFFIEPLGPYLELGLEYVDMITAATRPVWEVIGPYIEAGWQAAVSLLRDLFG